MGRLASAVGAAEGKSVEGETNSGGSTAETSHKAEQPQQGGDESKPAPGVPVSDYYRPPAFLDDLDSQPGLLDDWSRLVDQTVESIVLRRKGFKKLAGKTLHFFNPARERDTLTKPTPVKWLAFPKNLDNQDDRWAKADKREFQDEYCEWEVTRNSDGELLEVTFTTEVPEYYDFLASTDADGDRLLGLYNNHNSKDDVKREDLLEANGKYNRRNRWNIRSDGESPGCAGAIAHLLRANNTLEAIVMLVVDSTILVPDPKNAGKYLTKYQDRLPYIPKVSKESAGRNSDPVIAAHINQYVQKGKRITITNPLGPYIDTFEDGKIRSGNVQLKAKDVWQVRRSGDDDHVVRATFTVPRRFIGKLQDHRGNKIRFGSQIAQYVWIEAQVAVADSGPPPGAEVAPPQLLSYIEGREVKPTPLDPEFINDTLRKEPFGRYLATTQEPARTLKGLIARMPNYTWIAYAADEGIGHETLPPRKEVRVRLVIICTPDNPTRRPTNGSLMADPASMEKVAFKKPTYAVVAVSPKNDLNNVHSENSILQVASFSPENGFFNFYDRERHGIGIGRGKWLYFGSSKDAFTPDTQGLGPFCGHANGCLTMKEIEEPWPHWHRTETPLKLPPDHPMMHDPLFQDQTSGLYFGEPDHMARMVVAGTKAWFTKRRFLDFGHLRKPHPVAKQVHQWVAHVCLTTSITLSCSKGGDEAFRIPRGFFFNSSALSLVMTGIPELEDAIAPCTMANYRDAFVQLGLSTLNSIKREAGQFSIAAESEGSAPWKVLVPGTEDVEGIQQILEVSFLPKKVLIALLMVDFWNPIFSQRRARLMRYIPSTAVYRLAKASTQDRYGFGGDLVEAIEYAKVSLGWNDKSPEAEFLKLVNLENLEEVAKNQIKEFVDKVNVNLGNPQGVLGYMRVAETRRRMFRPPLSLKRPVHPLAEFDLALPYSTQMPDSETWLMLPDASVKNAEPSHKIWHPRNTQAHFSSAGCPFSASF